jgi:hypothetical protein
LVRSGPQAVHPFTLEDAMTQKELYSISAAIDRLADAMDTLQGDARVRALRIMQELSEMTDTQVNIEECLQAAAEQ